MKNKLSTFIIAVVFFLIFVVFILFGIIFWSEYKKLETSITPQNFNTVVEENQNTIDEDIKAPEIIGDSFGGIKDPNITPKEPEEPEEPKEMDYSNVSINKYFYNQLEDASKIIYNAFETNKENMKTGNYKIELGNSFSDLLKEPNGQDELGKYYQSAIEAYTYDNPDVFYLRPNKLYLNIETITRRNSITYNVFINAGNQGNYFIEEFSSKEKIEEAIRQIEQVRNEILQNKTNNEYQNIKMVHDYLIENIQYDTSISKSNIYNIYGAMVNKESVCEGYARSFKYLMDALEIPCILVIGKGTNSENRTENHAWNYVQLNHNWYAVDCTWDDPISVTGWVSESSKTKYFMKGSNTMSKDHTPKGQFTENGKIFYYPRLSDQDYK